VFLSEGLKKHWTPLTLIFKRKIQMALSFHRRKNREIWDDMRVSKQNFYDWVNCPFLH